MIFKFSLLIAVTLAQCCRPSLNNLSRAVCCHGSRICSIEDKCDSIQDCIEDLKASPDVTKTRVGMFNLENGGPSRLEWAFKID